MFVFLFGIFLLFSSAPDIASRWAAGMVIPAIASAVALAFAVSVQVFRSSETRWKRLLTRGWFEAGCIYFTLIVLSVWSIVAIALPVHYTVWHGPLAFLQLGIVIVTTIGVVFFNHFHSLPHRGSQRDPMYESIKSRGTQQSSETSFVPNTRICSKCHRDK